MIGHPVMAGQHRYGLRVYYEDTDAGGVVYHATYLRFAERARTEALRDLGVAHAEMVSGHGVMFMVRRIKLDYARPALIDEPLVVITHPLAVGAASVELRQIVARDGQTLVTLDVQLACVRLADQRPGRIPPRWRSALRAMMAELELAPFGAQ